MIRAVAALVASVALFGAVAAAASAADRYIASNGTDSAACTQSAAPCKTWSYVQDQSVAGDTVHFRAGSYSSSNFPGGFTVSKALALQGAQAGIPAKDQQGSTSTILVPITVRAAWTTIDGLRVSSGSASVGVDVIATDVSIANTVVLASAGTTAVSGAVNTAVRDSDLTATSNGVTGTYNLTVTGSRVVATRAVTADGGRLVATSNTIRNGDIGFLVNNSTTAEIHGNTIAGDNTRAIFGSGRTTVNAEHNWYGCNGGPRATGCNTVTLQGAGSAEPHLVLATSVTPDPVAAGGVLSVNASLQSSDGAPNPYPAPPATTVTFTTTLGTLSKSVATLSDTQPITTVTTPSTGGDGVVRVTLDHATIALPFRVRVPGLTVDPSGSDFGTVAIGGSSAVRAFTVANASGIPVHIRSISLEGAGADQFGLWANGCRTTLADGTSCSVSAALKPTSAGAKAARIEIVADGIADPVTIPLAGNGTADGAFDVLPRTGWMGSVSVGGASARQTLTVGNYGSQPLAITSITTGGDSADFVVSANACRTTLAPGESCAISASFRPQSAGNKTVEITLKAAGQAPQSAYMAGLGVAPALTISPATRDFGTVAVGSSTKQAFTITNNGAVETPVTLGGISLAGGGSDAYTLYASGCAKRTLAVGESCEISVFLRPTTPGLKTAAITVTASGQPVGTIDLVGTAT